LEALGGSHGVSDTAKQIVNPLSGLNGVHSIRDKVADEFEARGLKHFDWHGRISLK
jgi:hypothetical protein